MPGCEILDFRCMFVSEIFGNVVLAVIGVSILYFIIAAKLRFGFDTTIAFGVPLLLIFGLMFAGFSVLYAFLTLLGAILLAFIFQKIIGNR